MNKTLEEMLNNIDQVGVGDIISWYNHGYEKKGTDLEILLDAYTESISRERPSIDEQIANTPKFELTPAWSEDEYILASDLWKIFKHNLGTVGKKKAVDEIRKYISKH